MLSPADRTTRLRSMQKSLGGRNADYIADAIIKFVQAKTKPDQSENEAKAENEAKGEGQGQGQRQV